MYQVLLQTRLQLVTCWALRFKLGHNSVSEIASEMHKLYQFLSMTLQLRGYMYMQDIFNQFQWKQRLHKHVVNFLYFGWPPLLLINEALLICTLSEVRCTISVYIQALHNIATGPLPGVWLILLKYELFMM